MKRMVYRTDWLRVAESVVLFVLSAVVVLFIAGIALGKVG